MKFCPECGAKFAEGAKFCSECGGPRLALNPLNAQYGPKEVFIFVAFALFALEGSNFDFEIDENAAPICCTFNHLIEFDKQNRMEIRSLLSQLEEEGYFVCNTYWEDGEDDLEGLESWIPSDEASLPVVFLSSEARKEALEFALKWGGEGSEIQPWMSEFLVDGLRRVNQLTQCQHSSETAHGSKCEKCGRFVDNWQLAKLMGLVL